MVGGACNLEEGRVAVFSSDSPSGKVNMKSKLLTGSLVPSVTVILALAFVTKMLRSAFERTFASMKRRGHS
jgi:hypothetical protein